MSSLAGKCFCGAVHYAVADEFTYAMNCHCSQCRRTTGSAFKPIVYAKSFEIGYTPNTVLWDVETTFPTVTGNYTPHNYDLGELGPLRVRDALQRSLNIPAVETLYLAGLDNVLQKVADLGYTTLSDRSRFGLSLTLGGGEVTMLEMATAFGVIANLGTKVDLNPINRIEDTLGQNLYQAAIQ